MDNVHLLLQGFQVVFTLQNLGATLLGCVIGLIIGAMPGIGSLAGCALLLPLTYKFSPTTAIISAVISPRLSRSSGWWTRSGSPMIPPAVFRGLSDE